MYTVLEVFTSEGKPSYRLYGNFHGEPFQTMQRAYRARNRLEKENPKGVYTVMPIRETKRFESDPPSFSMPERPELDPNRI